MKKPNIPNLKSVKPKRIGAVALSVMQKHTLTILIFFAGILIGYALYSVNDLTHQVSSEQLDTETNISAGQGKINLDKATESSLLVIAKDTDVNISSNIASYRRSAFSDSAVESQWVIEAARLLEQYKVTKGGYPNVNSINSALSSQDSAFIITDDSGLAINEDGGMYTYASDGCDDKGCTSFLLTANLGSSLYQLGETDHTKRSWINETAQALDIYYKLDNKRRYPLEGDVTSALSVVYKDTFNKTFTATDPNGKKINESGSAYTYRGIDCDRKGCNDFVLRTTFKDGASYYQQSQ